MRALILGARQHPLWLVYGTLGLASGLAWLRLLLELLSAAELGPVGRGLITIGGWVVAPFGFVAPPSRFQPLPGSSYDLPALIAGLVYLGLGLVVALAMAISTKNPVRTVKPD